MSAVSVKVIEGRNLIACDKNGASDPFCLITVGKHEKKTNVVKKTLNPNWAEGQKDYPFIFKLDKDNATEVTIRVFDWNIIGASKKMGRVVIPINEIKEGQVLEKWCTLGLANGMDKVSGEIFVQLSLVQDKGRSLRDTASYSSKSTYQFVPVSINSQNEDSPLFNAIRNSDLYEVRKLLNDPKTNVNMQDAHGYTPLHAACVIFSENDDEIMLALLNTKDIDLKLSNKDGNSQLHYFCQKYRSPNCAEAFELFIQKGADVNAQNHLKETPLHKAMYNNSLRVLLCGLLLKAGANPNLPNVLNETVLHYAARYSRDDLILQLFKAGADVSIKDKDGNTPLQVCEKVTFGGSIGSKTMADQSDRTLKILQRAAEITSWLEEIGLAEYRFNFIKQEIYKDILPDVDEKMLGKLGVSNPEHLKTIMKAVDKLKGSGSHSDESVKLKTETGESFETVLTRLKHIRQDKNWVLSERELEFDVKLGSGAAGTVYKGLYRGQQVAIKVLKTEQTHKELEEFKKEFQIMSSITSQYLVLFFGAVLEPKLCMVMELCSRGSLFHVLNDPEVNVGWERMLGFALECAKGVQFLHENTPQIVHRDLKSLNLMVNQDFHVKVGDFGLSRFNTDTSKETLGKLRGTFAYLCPQVYYGKPFSPLSDVYSVAIILWELVHRCLKSEYLRPYGDRPNLKFDFQIIIQTAKNGIRPTIPKQTPQKLSALIQQGWDPIMENRPVIKVVVETLEEVLKEYRANSEEWDKLIEAAPVAVPKAEDSQ